MVEFTKDGWGDYLYWQSQDKKTLKRINKLLEDILRHLDEPLVGVGKPEALRYNLTGYYSRRINDQDRLIYALAESGLCVIACKGHY